MRTFSRYIKETMRAAGSDRGALLLMAVGCMTIASIPFIYLHHVTGSFLPRIIPELVSDQLYYLAQLQEVAWGNWLLGNPYLIEHAGVRSPGLLLPVWIAAIPMYLGLSLQVTYALNTLLYSCCIAGLIYATSRKAFEFRPFPSALLGLTTVLFAFDLIIRPVSMQVIFTVFLLWLLAFFCHVRKPTTWTFFWVGAAMVLAFHTYLHLWMIIFTTMGLHTLTVLFRRRWTEIRPLIVLWVFVALLCAPQAYVMVHDSQDLALKELAYRIAAVHTHFVRPIVLLNLKYIVFLIGVFFAIRISRPWKKYEYSLLLVCLAILIVAVSNLVTGIELEFLTIPWRYTLMVLPLALGAFIRLAASRQSFSWRLASEVVILVLLVAILDRVIIYRNSFSFMLPQAKWAEAFTAPQRYEEVFAEMRKRSPSPVVVLAPFRMSHFIPAFTQHYVLYARPSRFHPVSSQELLERLLILNVDTADRSFIADQVNAYSGVGPIHELDTLRDCASLHLCDPNKIPKRAVDLIGGDAFLDKGMQTLHAIDTNYESYLKKYHVHFVVSDAHGPQNPRIPKDAKEVWRGGDFVLYEYGPPL